MVFFFRERGVRVGRSKSENVYNFGFGAAGWGGSRSSSKHRVPWSEYATMQYFVAGLAPVPKGGKRGKMV